MIEFIRSLVVQAGEVLKKSKATISSQKSGGGNWVTEADLQVEKFILEEIRRKFPDHAIVAEESFDGNKPAAKDIWLVDPLDGTTNATYGLPIFGISIAYMHNDKVQAGAIYDAGFDQVYWAQRNKGSHRDNEPIKVKPNTLSNSLVCTGSPYSREDFRRIHPLYDQIHQKGARLLILGSAAIEACYVADGKLSAYFEIGLKPWDIAAASLIVEEAGGVARSFEGGLDIFRPDSFVCGNKTIVEEIGQLATN